MIVTLYNNILTSDFFPSWLTTDQLVGPVIIAALLFFAVLSNFIIRGQCALFYLCLLNLSINHLSCMLPTLILIHFRLKPGINILVREL